MRLPTIAEGFSGKGCDLRVLKRSPKSGQLNEVPKFGTTYVNQGTQRRQDKHVMPGVLHINLTD